jgi:hypothetical protein
MVREVKILITILYITSISYAQQDFDKWLEKEQRKFQEFKDKRDKDFVEFLEKQWRAIQLLKGIDPDNTPKPVKFPVTEPKVILPGSSQTINEIRVPTPPLKKEAESIEIFISSFLNNKTTLSFSFFNTQLKINYDKTLLKLRLTKPIREEQISTFWADLSHSNYEDLLEQSLQLKKYMQLNDWGYCLLLNRIGEELFSDRNNEHTLFLWFMLLKSSYDVKVCYDQVGVYFLLPSTNTIFGLPYFIMDDNKYYIVTFDNTQKTANSVYTYNGNYPDSEKLISLDIENSPALGPELKKRKLKFTYDKKEFEIGFNVRKDIIDFYNKYPQTNFEVYFDASLSSDAQYSLLQNVKILIEGKTEAEAVNILLRFVQTAFEYKNDNDQFGKEKPFFAEETLFYPFSDCEDRSVLFAYLVRNLIGLDVIGLDYPGHISTAVKFSTEIEGDFIIFSGEKYVICDATYINANIGHVMKRYKNINPNIITIGKYR